MSWSSVKIRMALPEDYYGADIALPPDLSAEDLATLSIVYLLQHARRSVDSYADAHRCRGNFGFNLGVPMTTMDNPELCDRFVQIARVAYAIERWGQAPDFRKGVFRDEAASLLKEGRQKVPAYKPESSQEKIDQQRQWVRSEFEAALLWPFKSPQTREGLYRAVDVGAGTTSASFFSITTELMDGRNVKSGIAFFGASCRPPGGDAIDKKLSSPGSDPSSMRGKENEFLAMSDAPSIADLLDEVFETYRSAFGHAFRKYQNQSAWADSPLFFIGGGTEIDAVKTRLKHSPDKNLKQNSTTIEVGQPPDLLLEGVNPRDLKFLLVAYGLSYNGVDIPEATLPSEIEPLDPRRRVIDLDPSNPREFARN